MVKKYYISIKKVINKDKKRGEKYSPLNILNKCKELY